MKQIQDIRKDAAILLAGMDVQILRHMARYLDTFSGLDVSALSLESLLAKIAELYKRRELLMQIQSKNTKDSGAQKLDGELDLEAAKYEVFERIRKLQRGAEL